MKKTEKRATIVSVCAKSVHQSNSLSRNMCFVDNMSALNKNQLLILTFLASKVQRGDFTFEKIAIKPSTLSLILNINLEDRETRNRFKKDVIELAGKRMVIQHKDSKSFISAPFFSWCQYDDENCQYIFKLNECMAPYYLGFSENSPRTIFKFGYIRMLPSVYSRRLYMIAASIKNLAGGVAYTIEKLYAVLGYTDQTRNFSSRVLTKAMLDINALTDITLQAFAIKEGRKVIGYIFKSRAKSKDFMDIQEIYPAELPDSRSERERIKSLYKDPDGVIDGEVIIKHIQYRDLTPKQQTAMRENEIIG